MLGVGLSLARRNGGLSAPSPNAFTWGFLLNPTSLLLDGTATGAVGVPASFTGPTLSPTITLLDGTVTTATPLLIDTLSVSPAIAISSRKLRSAYAGSALNAGTNAASGSAAGTNIGFSGEDLDTTALDAVGSTVYLVKYYDQSGNGRDFADNTIFGTSLTRPKLRISGTDVTINSKICMQCTPGEGNKVTDPFGSTITGPFTYYMVAKWDTVSGILVDGRDGVRHLFGNNAGQYYLYNNASDVSTGTNDTNVHCFIWEFNGTAWSLQVDGSTSSGTYGGSVANLTGSSNIMLGGNNNNTPPAKYCEFMLFAGSLLSAGDKTALRASAQAYWGTP
jgi:hypothetical protein